MRIRFTSLERSAWLLGLLLIFPLISWAQFTPFSVTTPCPAPAAQQNQPYSLAITVTGASSGPLSFSLNGTPLPAGLSLNSPGTISGIPAVSGSFPISVKVVDSQGQVAFYDCSIIVQPALAVTTACPITSIPTTLTATGGSGSYAFSIIGTLPASLTLNGNVIGGSLTAPPGTYGFTVQVTSGQQSAQEPCSIVVSAPPAPLVITSGCPASPAQQGSSVYFTLAATGGSGNYTWSGSAGLPAGLALSGNVISGSLGAQPGTYGFTVHVTDGQQTVQEICSIVVTPPPPPPLVITSGCPTSPAQQGSAFSFTLTATGASGNYAWSIQPGLPGGLTLNTNTISGVPAGPPGTSNFSVQVTSGTTIASIPCSLTISPPPLQLTSGCPGNGFVGTPYAAFPLTATGGLGAGTYTFSVQGTLPVGLSLATNTINGTPTTAGTYVFSVTVASGTQTAVSPQCSVTIALAPLKITVTCPAASLTVGSPVSISFASSGGQPPYKFATTGATWLTISAPGSSSGVASGTPGVSNIGSFTVTLTVTDATPTTASSTPCNFTVTPVPLLISGSCPTNPVTAGSQISVPVNGSGGVQPYAWALTGNSGLTLAASQGVANNFNGNAPSAPGTYTLIITLSDSAMDTPATLSCTIKVQFPPLQITGTCPAATLNLPLTLSIPLSASGGQAPYTWMISGPSWISLSGSTGAATTIGNSAAPSAAGPFSFSVTLSDSASSTPALFSCNSSINSPPVPGITVTGLTLPPSLLNLTSPGIQLSNAATLSLTGTVQLTFLPNAFGITDNPQVYFNGGSRTATFTIAPGQNSFILPSVQPGTDAGTIHLEVTDLQQGGVDVLSTPHPSSDLVIPHLVPVVATTDVSFANETTNGFDVIINGYSTPRDMTSVTLMFTAASGASLSGTTSFTVNLSSLFTTFYSSAASQLAGSQWQNLHVPVTTTGDKTAIGSVTVTLTNSAGSSQAITLTR